MAENWIKLRTMLRRDGRVRNLSRALATNVTHAFGALATLWCIADELADETGVIFGYTVRDIDSEIGIEGFCEALPSEWIDLSGEWVKLPDYQEHNGSTAKKRSQDQKRQRRRREKVEIPSRANSTKRVTREEERREESNTHTVSAKTSKSRPMTREECVEYCFSVGLKSDDGEWLWDKWEGNGHSVNGKAMKSWQATVRAWKRQNYFPSQKQQLKGVNGTHREFDRNAGTANDGLFSQYKTNRV